MRYGKDDMKRRFDLISLVYNQLPEGIREQFHIDVDYDAYCLHATAHFVDPHRVKWSVDLEDEPFEGAMLKCRIPEAFVAQLAAIALNHT